VSAALDPSEGPLARHPAIAAGDGDGLFASLTSSHRPSNVSGPEKSESWCFQLIHMIARSAAIMLHAFALSPGR